jgi:hypothetical protein
MRLADGLQQVGELRAIVLERSHERITLIDEIGSDHERSLVVVLTGIVDIAVNRTLLEQTGSKSNENGTSPEWIGRVSTLQYFGHRSPPVGE